MQNVTLVPLSQETLEEVAAIEQEAGDTRWSRAQFEKELSLPVSRFFVMLRGCKILGYGGYWKVQDEAQVTNLAVPPAQRRQGIGQRLLEYLLQQARGEGCRVITLEVRSRNQAAQALYLKNGFEIQGRRPKAYSTPEDDAILMEKKL